MTSPLSIGLIGAGGIGRTHAEHLVDEPGADLVAVCDLDVDRAEAVARAAGARAYMDYRDALSADGLDLDAVYVATPPQSRVEIVREVARAGAAIFCETPLAATLEDGREIATLVETYDVPFTVGFCLRFAEPLWRLRALVTDGEIGDPVCLFSVRTGWGVPAGDDWRTDPTQACGVAVESIVHDVDLLRWLGGEIATAAGATTNVTRPDLERFDDNVVAHVTFENGAIGVILNSWTSRVETFRHGVVGTEGTAVATGDGWWRLDRLEHATRTESTTTEFDDTVASEMGYRLETRAFIESVAAGTDPPVDVSEGLRALEITNEILDA